LASPVARDRLSGRPGAGSEKIRRAIARDLHDRVAQTLTTMLIELETFKAEHNDNQAVVRQFGELQESTRDVLNNLRHILYDLRGETGIEEHFAESVRALLKSFHERTHVDVILSVAPSWPERLRTSAALNLYRIIEEALSNVRLHSGARLVEVALGPALGSSVAVEVRDNGRGARIDGHNRPGLGLLGMHERAVILGGRLEVNSVAGHGTTIRAILRKEDLI
jgi:signal transduction histidine kinase